MDTISLKKYIYDNKKIEEILQSIGCHIIKYHSLKNYYSSAFSNGDNPMGVIIKNTEYLNFSSYSRSDDFDENSDIITLVEYEKNISFVEAVKYIHKLLGIEYKYKYKPKTEVATVNPLNIFEKYKCKKQFDIDDIKILDECLLDEFIPILHISWLREGIMPWTAEKFGIAYSYKRKRIIIPIRHWLSGELVGTNMRTTIDNYSELDIRKYFITPTYKKGLNLYGLWENRKSIEERKVVVVYESEKSVLKRDSLCDHTGVALQGKSISEEQIRILKGLDVYEIVIALDKDVNLQEVRYICERLRGSKKISYIYDKWDLMNDKECCADKQCKVYDFLFKYRVSYDEKEHKEYLRELENKQK